MTLDEYQELAMRTWGQSREWPTERRLTVSALGLTGEAGEVAELVKKHVGHGHTLDSEKVKKELGDVLWYVAALATTLGLSMEDVGAANIEKLKARYPEGFSSTASINRSVNDV